MMYNYLIFKFERRLRKMKKKRKFCRIHNNFCEILAKRFEAC